MAATALRLTGYDSAEIGVDQAANVWAPPIAPTQLRSTDDIFLREQEFDVTAEGKPAIQGDPHQILKGLGSQRKLMIGSVLVAALALGLLAYAHSPTAGERTDAKNAEVNSAVQSAPAAPVEAIPQKPERPFVEPTAVAWPDLPPLGIVEALPQTTSPALTTNTVRQSVTSQNQNIVFVQRPDVNIRSGPSTNGTVVGTAPKANALKL